MEESTESHMETDVSSTTDDVPESQEVTGSDGNVEMIIVVEKIDDEPSADEETEEQPSLINEDTKNLISPEDKLQENEIQTPKSPAKSPVKFSVKPVVKVPVKSPAKSPTKSPAKSPIKSPTKLLNIETEVPDTQSKPEVEQIVLEAEPEKQNDILPSVEKQQVEAADSSIKEPGPIQSEEKPNQIQNTSKKDIQNPDQKSPVKDLQSLDSARLSPSKESSLIDNTQVNGKVQCNDTGKKDDTNIKAVTTIIPIDITIETSNDSQIELSDMSEKEHKSISRELKSLINSAKESKIISECTQLTSKTRKSRTALDTSSSSLNSSHLEPNRIHDTRRNSDMSQKSNCSEKSEKVVLKRSMRSQNPEFVSKVKQFLNSVTGKGNKDSEDEEEETQNPNLLEPVRRTPPKLKKSDPTVTEKSNKLRSDSYCWRCHWVVEQETNEKLHRSMLCTVCPRSFHYKCLTGTERNKINVEKNWVCPECMVVLQAESSETRSQAMKKISLGMLCDLLKHALERMMDLNGVEPFMQPVDRASFPDYDKYVVHPMDLSLMKENITEGLYGSTEAFLADSQWILHNSIIFNTLQSKLTAAARALVRSCRAEMGEIEACPECYAAAHARRPTWFTDVCTTPHILFWAKLKGFPYWPAKGMSVNGNGLVDVRFFGAHDRAWVPAKDCFLYCEKDPNNFRTKRQDIIDSMQEAEQHIRNISRKYGRFVYPPFKTLFDPSKMHEQLKMMIPTFEGEVGSLVKKKASPTAANKKSRSNSKSSKTSFNEGLLLHSDSSDSDEEELQRLYALLDKESDTSDTEDTTKTARKMADGAEIAKIEDDDSSTLDKEMETDAPAEIKIKDDSHTSNSTTASRKRRRSALEEAVITIIESSGSSCSSTSEKRRKLDELTDDNKTNENVPTSSKVDDKPTTDKAQEETNEDTHAKTDETPPKGKDTDLRSSVEKDKLRVTPIRIALVTKEKRKTRNSSSTDTTGKIITPNKDKEQDKTPQKSKSTRSEKIDRTSSAKADKVETSKAEKTPGSKSEKNEKTSNSKSEKNEKTPSSKEKVEKTPSDKTTKEDRSRAQKRRNSRSSRSTNSTSSTRSSDKTEKKSQKNAEGSSKDKRRESSSSAKEKDKDGGGDKSRMEKQMSPKSTPELLSPKSVKDRLHFDDDTTLAVLARESSKSIGSSNSTGLPTISCVRSLSTTAQITGLTTTKTTTNANTIDITEEATSESSIFTPTSTTSTENVKTMQDTVSKLQRLRKDAEPVVGRVGVRAFARMTSPERQANDEVQVEIKAEPIDLDDADRHMEKMDLMNAFRLRPVNPQNIPQVPPTPTLNLRDVRINKVVVTPLNARKTATGTATAMATKAPEIRPRAKKTFPQPKKPEEGRSELNSKNSMVYIPIQPPMTQAPVRMPRPAQNVVPSVLRAPVTSAVNNLVNTVTTPLMQSSSSPPSTSATITSNTSVATVPTVHTVPLMTSVNGQWMFSFQPVMSVGAIENTASPPILNGIAERGNTSAPLATLTPSTPIVGTVVSGLPVVSASSSGPAPPITVLNRTTSENTLGEPPRLQQRPTQFLLNPLDASTPIGSMPPPSTAGPVTAKLNQNAVKMTDFFRTLLEDSLEKLDEPWSHTVTLRLQLEQEQWRHQQELKEVKHNHDLTIAEMRAAFEKDKLRAVSEARRVAQVELEAAVKLAKSKQWCANCRQEAQFYCCWNTSYCDLPCQRAHWSQHFSTCQQRSQNDSIGEPPNSPENRLQPHPDIMPVLQKNTSAPTMTVGGKLASSRAFNQDPNAQKASIIVSMVEDTSGNQTMKCVGTYKPSQTGQQIQPIIINKQLMNKEENANKKVVASSGGYLIVGAPNNSSVVTPARRTHTIQYYTS